MSKKMRLNQICSLTGDQLNHLLSSPAEEKTRKTLKKVTFDNYALYLQFRASDCPNQVNSTLQQHHFKRSNSANTQF
ncbi:unnamed protein product (macronuclear) [Paramecium tetraurelia]|uniref:Uncharacterized protein n=2 Tax=Paramecium TaxID=5884 RepID=A0CFG2_PARTE|nr:uncharacterized protein GSPATT00037968001 [Paramecium tetraurelia]CAD8172764.1 unnamed protein product [Paramecium octaurelia]CAK69529.1 unnamed protein product [Paramecium tetraurelia]|eukprot:XP_001436926.1 hypothetical protein (macronuclear) [Paramecium tetraurelia strain d4-2]